MTFNDHLRNFSWISYWVERDEVGVLHVAVSHRHLRTEYVVPLESMHTRAGQAEFMRLATANREKLKRDLAAVEAVTDALLKGR